MANRYLTSLWELESNWNKSCKLNRVLLLTGQIMLRKAQILYSYIGRNAEILSMDTIHISLHAHTNLLFRMSFLEHKRSILVSWKGDNAVSIYIVYRHKEIACNFFPSRDHSVFWMAQVLLLGRKLRKGSSKDQCFRGQGEETLTVFLSK